MRHLSIAALILLAPFAAVAEESDVVAAACDARGIGNAEDCACLQSAADEAVRPGLHGLVADHLGERVDVAQIAAERGHSGAEALYDANEAFKAAAQKMCAVDLSPGT